MEVEEGEKRRRKVLFSLVISGVSKSLSTKMLRRGSEILEDVIKLLNAPIELSEQLSSTSRIRSATVFRVRGVRGKPELEISCDTAVRAASRVVTVGWERLEIMLACSWGIWEDEEDREGEQSGDLFLLLLFLLFRCFPMVLCVVISCGR